MRVLMSLVISIGLLSASIFAEDSPNTIISELGASKSKRIKYLTERHAPAFIRPASCPMASKSHADILGKIKNIKNLFKDNCAGADQGQLDELLSGAEAIQSNIDTATQSTGLESVEVSGEAISSVMGNINSVLSSGQCNFKDGSFLENTADVVASFSQMGLLVPSANGLIISAGGLAISSILRIMHNLFTPLFDFEKNSERSSFIKLNCAFYDIRRDIEASGFLDVATERHITDLKEVRGINKELTERAKRLAAEKESIFKGLTKKENDLVAKELGELNKLAKLIESAKAIVAAPVKEEGGVPATAKKLEVIQELTLLKNSLETSLKAYTESGMSKIPPLDRMLERELAKLDFVGESIDQYMELINQSVSSFNEGLRANLLFHFGRISNDLLSAKLALKKNFNEATLVEGQSILNYKKKLTKKVTELLKSNDKKLKKMKMVELRLSRITKDRNYTSTDDGEENIVAILSDYNSIAEQIYGKWGEKFLRYTTESSYKINKKFVSNFLVFSKSHLKEEEGKLTVPEAAEVSELSTLYACQDAMPFRRTWKLGNSLSQNGYDFLATNKDLFHSDTAESLMSMLYLKRSDFKRIQHHYKSAMFAKKMIKGEEVSQSNREKYLEKKATHKRYLGMVMLEVNKSKAKAALIQELIERFECSRVTAGN